METGAENTFIAPAASDPEALRDALVDRLLRHRQVGSGPVEAALRGVPRHLFVPEVPVEQAYALDVVITKRRPDGRLVSLASEPGVVATLLEQLDVRPGQRVLEIGAGTGYNAALLAHLAGPEGEVTAVEYDAETAERARRGLAAAGYDDVLVVHGDGGFGHAGRA